MREEGLELFWRFLLLVSTGLAPFVPVIARSQPTARFAIVIGYNGTQDPGVTPLQFADDDAIATHALLTEAGVAALLFVEMDADTQRLHPALVPAAAPTLDALFEHFNGLSVAMARAAAEGRQTDFFLVYSGHGDVEHGQGYVELKGGRLTRQVLYEKLLGRSPATRNHVLVDACKSYFLAFERGPGGERTPYQGLLPTENYSVRANTGFMLSTSSAKDSHEWELFQAGVFSHELRSALRGAADIDDDGRITYAEVGAFLTTANADIPNGRLRPDFLIHPPGGDSAEFWQQPALVWPRRSSVVVLDVGPGHVYGETSTGLRLFDAHPRAGTPVRIRVPAEQAVFIHDAADTWERQVLATAPSEGGGASLSALVATPNPLRRRGALHNALLELFARPFGLPELIAYEQSASLTLDTFVPAEAIAPQIAAWTAGSCAVLGLGLDMWALERYRAGRSAPQARRAQLNGRIQALHSGAFAAYGLSAIAASTWILLSARWLGGFESSWYVEVAPNAVVEGGHLALRMAW